MGELIRRSGALSRRGQGVVGAPASAAASTARIDFSAEAITWADLPRETRRAARRRTRLLVEDVQVTAVGRSEHGATWQDASAWRLHEDAVLVAKVARPVVLAGPTIARAGRWVHRGIEIRAATSGLRQRAGVVEVVEETVSRGGGGPIGARAIDHAEAARTWRYLPLVVRDGAENLVPDPDVWLATLVQHRRADGLPEGQELRVLRMSAERMIVLHASRHAGAGAGGSKETRGASLAAAPWAVEQFGFDLTDARLSVEGGEARR